MDAGMLSDLRADATAELLANGDATTAQVYVYNETDTDLGGQTNNFDAGTVYPCLLQAGVKIPKEGLQAEQTTSMADYVAKLPWNATVSVRDKLRINGHDYEVIDANRDQTERLLLNVSLKKPNE